VAAVVETFQGVLVALLAVLPGALYTWGFEREAGQWGIGFADRLLRFVGWSALLHTLLAPVTFQLWDHYVRSGRLGRGQLPFWSWFVLMAYVAIPAVTGALVGRSARQRGRLSRLLAGPHPAPTAWEHLFGHDPYGMVRLRLTSGTYIAGLYGLIDDSEESYASGFPHQPVDLWLARGVEVDADTGEFIADVDGSPIVLESGILVRYDEVQFLEFFPQEG
jgi:hypothetical protein